MNISNDKSAAWPVANPVVTCASASESGFPSNFVADPFLYRQVTSIFHLVLMIFLIILSIYVYHRYVGTSLLDYVVFIEFIFSW